MPAKTGKPLLEFNDRLIQGNLSAYPSVVELKNIVPGKTYEFTITAQNLAKEPRLIRAILSNHQNYIIKNISQLEVNAPYGLDKKIVIEFTPKEEREYVDSVIIKSDRDQIEVRIEGYVLLILKNLLFLDLYQNQT